MVIRAKRRWLVHLSVPESSFRLFPEVVVPTGKKDPQTSAYVLRAGDFIWNRAPPGAIHPTQRPSWGALYRRHLEEDFNETVAALRWLAGTGVKFPQPTPDP